jgi:hypothetical protein
MGNMPDWHPVALAFEVVAHERGPDEERTLTITSVLRDDFAVRVNYEIVPPLSDVHFGPWGEADGDTGNRYDDGGGVFGHDPGEDRTDGTLSFPLPPREATQLNARVEWVYGDTWYGGTHELRIELRHAASAM